MKKDRNPYMRERYQVNRDFVNQYKTEHGCTDCGITNWIVLDLHHTSDKIQNVSKMITKGYSLDRIKEEMDKCIVLCANCHRIKHYTNNRV